MQSILSQNLRKARKFKNWTQQQTAQAIGIPRTNYESYEACRASPSPTILVEIAKVLDVENIYSLVMEENYDPANPSNTPHQSLIDKKYGKLLPKEKKIVDILLNLNMR